MEWSVEKERKRRLYCCLGGRMDPFWKWHKLVRGETECLQRKLNAKQKAKMSQVLLRSFHLEEKKELKTRPSILCVTHQMSRKKRNDSVGWTVPYEMMNYKRYLMVLGQYLAGLAGTLSVLGGTGSARQGLYACIYWKKWRFGRVLPMPDISLTHS